MTKSQKMLGKNALSKGCSEEYSGNLFTGYAPAVIQATWLNDRLYYGTRDLHHEGHQRETDVWWKSYSVI